jgi:hypothetical protein
LPPELSGSAPPEEVVLTMIVEVQAIPQGWKPSVMQAGFFNLEPETSRVSENLQTALYQSWFASDRSVRSDVHFPNVRKIAWIAPGDSPKADGRDHAECQTVRIQ